MLYINIIYVKGFVMATYVIGDTHFGKDSAAVRTGSKTLSEHDAKAIKN